MFPKSKLPSNTHGSLIILFTFDVSSSLLLIPSFRWPQTPLHVPTKSQSITHSIRSHKGDSHCSHHPAPGFGSNNCHPLRSYIIIIIILWLTPHFGCTLILVSSKLTRVHIFLVRKSAARIVLLSLDNDYTLHVYTSVCIYSLSTLLIHYVYCLGMT